MKYFLTGVLGFLICFGILVGFQVYNGDTKLIIQTNNIVQYKTHTKYIRVPYAISKTNIYTNYIYLLDELNKFVAGQGWIDQSNKQIYAGIYTRAWSAPYLILQPNYKHSIGVLIGNGLLIDYSYQLLKRVSIRGGLLSQSDKKSLLIGSSFKF